MLQFLRLDYYSSEMLLLLLLSVSIGGFVVGYITDAVMGGLGFGPFGNGLLAVLGAMIGVYVRNHFFARMEVGDVFITALFAAMTATLLLLLLGFIKNKVQD